MFIRMFNTLSFPRDQVLADLFGQVTYFHHSLTDTFGKSTPPFKFVRILYEDRSFPDGRKERWQSENWVEYTQDHHYVRISMVANDAVESAEDHMLLRSEALCVLITGLTLLEDNMPPSFEPRALHVSE